MISVAYTADWKLLILTASTDIYIYMFIFQKSFVIVTILNAYLFDPCPVVCN